MSFRKPLTVKGRRAAGSYINGFYNLGAAGQDFTIYASVQPATGKDLLALPEGERSSVVFALFTSTELKTSEVAEKTESDIVIIDGDDYKVRSVEKWNNNLLNHFKCIVTRVKQ